MIARDLVIGDLKSYHSFGSSILSIHFQRAVFNFSDFGSSPCLRVSAVKSSLVLI